MNLGPDPLICGGGVGQPLAAQACVTSERALLAFRKWYCLGVGVAATKHATQHSLPHAGLLAAVQAHSDTDKRRPTGLNRLTRLVART